MFANKHLHWFVSGALFMLSFMLLQAAWAQPADVAPPSSSSDALVSPATAQQVADSFIQIIAGVLLVVLTWGARKAVVFFEAKTGIDIPQRTEAQLDTWIEHGIGLAEEKAHQKAKEKLGTLRGPEKLAIATDFVWGLVQKYKLEQYTKDAITEKVEAALGVKRNGGAH